MLQVILLPLLAVFGGIGGFFLRRWELTAAFEPDTGLAVLWTAPTVALIALSVVLAAAFFLLCRGDKYPLTAYRDAFAAPGNWAYLVVGAGASALLLVSGLWGLKEQLTGGAPKVLSLLLDALCLASFVCLLWIIPGNFRARQRQYSLALLLPAYTCCVWLVNAYQQRAADPVVLDYVYQLLAIICALLGLYFAAGFSFGRGRVWLCGGFTLLGVYFGIVTLADEHTLSDRLLLLGLVLYQMASAAALLRNAFLTGPAPGQEEPQADQSQEVTPDE
jgi:hypothetical protein